MTIYSDVNSYTPEDKALLTKVEAVYQSLDNIFETLVGERLFNVNFGNFLEDEIFEMMSEDSALSVFRAVTAMVERWERRVIIDDRLTVITPNLDDHEFDLYLVFEIQGVEDQKFEYRTSITK